MKKGNIITLDLTGCKTWYELHERIRIAFDFPGGYGHNWSAFSDFLWSECNANKINVIGAKDLPKELNTEILMMYKILQEEKAVRVKRGYDFDYEIVS